MRRDTRFIAYFVAKGTETHFAATDTGSFVASTMPEEDEKFLDATTERAAIKEGKQRATETNRVLMRIVMTQTVYRAKPSVREEKEIYS